MNKLTIIVLLVTGLAAASGCSSDALAQQNEGYSGQEKRDIKSLSSTDIEELKAGKGRGLAKAAELNGFPGPMHVIESKEKLRLSDEQFAQVTAVYNEMKEKAIGFGVKLIELEKELDGAFAGGTIDDSSLSKHLEKIAAVNKDLRFVHLAAHLKTRKILSEEQTAAYNKIRGYSSGDQCQNMPEGHDPALWKKHNNCP